jgi:hypothetical protein
MAAIQLLPLPIIAFMKDHAVLCPSWGLRLDMNSFQAFFSEMISLFFAASAFLQADRLSDESGERRHYLSACFTFSTAESHSWFHHGCRGSFEGWSDGVVFLKFFSLAAVIAYMNESNSCLEAVWSLKDVAVRWWVKSAFQLGHLALGRIHEGDLDVDLMGSVFSVVMMGRWSLPEKGQRKVEAFRARLDDEIMRSMIDYFPEDGLILVPRSFGVMIVASGWSVIAAKMDLPARFSVELDSHKLWWALKSPSTMKGSWGGNKRLISSAVQSPLGE